MTSVSRHGDVTTNLKGCSRLSCLRSCWAHERSCSTELRFNFNVDAMLRPDTVSPSSLTIRSGAVLGRATFLFERLLGSSDTLVARTADLVRLQSCVCCGRSWCAADSDSACLRGMPVIGTRVCALLARMCELAWCVFLAESFSGAEAAVCGRFSERNSSSSIDDWLRAAFNRQQTITAFTHFTERDVHESQQLVCQ